MPLGNRASTQDAKANGLSHDGTVFFCFQHLFHTCIAYPESMLGSTTVLRREQVEVMR